MTSSEKSKEKKSAVPWDVWNIRRDVGIVASFSVGIVNDISAIVDLFKVVFVLKYTWIYRYTLVGSKLNPICKYWLGLYLNPLGWFYTDEYNQILVGSLVDSARHPWSGL